jgi:hypothetical protein
VVFGDEDPVVKITDDEEIVLFAVTISELVGGDTSLELVEDADEVVEVPLDVVDGATLLLLELLGASLIFRAPLTPLLEVGLPSFFFI